MYIVSLTFFFIHHPSRASYSTVRNAVGYVSRTSHGKRPSSIKNVTVERMATTGFCLLVKRTKGLLGPSKAIKLIGEEMVNVNRRPGDERVLLVSGKTISPIYARYRPRALLAQED